MAAETTNRATPAGIQPNWETANRKLQNSIEALAPNGILQGLMDLAKQRGICSDGQQCAMEEYIRKGTKDPQYCIDMWIARLGGSTDPEVANLLELRQASEQAKPDLTLPEVPLASAEMDRRVLVTVATGSLHLFDVGSGMKRDTISFDFPLSAARFAGGGATVLAVSPDGVGNVLDLKKGEVLQQVEMQVGQGSISQVDMNGDGTCIAVSYSQDNVVSIFQADTGECLSRLSHPDFVNHLAISRDGMRIATAGSDKNVRLFDVSSAEVLQNWFVAENESRAAWLSSCHALAVALDETGAKVAAVVTNLGLETNQFGRRAWLVRILDSNDGKVVREIEYFDPVHAIAMSGSGDIVAVGRSYESQGSLCVFDATSGDQMYSLGHPHSVVAVAFDATDTRIATGAGSVATVFDVPSGQLRQSLHHETHMQSSPDSAVYVCAVGLLAMS